jgi:hypothetical protein
LARSAEFRTFAVVFAISTPVLYVICEMANWPLFTYHPGTNRIDLGWAAAVRDEGPAMHWYGWTANALIGAALLGLIGMKAPERLTARIPLSLVWLVPLAAIPVLIYALRFFWRW